MNKDNMTLVRKEILVSMAKAHNESVDTFVNVTLKERFGEKINLNQWFEAQRLINEQEFYKKGKGILDVIRLFGFDCKMDTQANKLYWPEEGIF